MNLLGSEIPPLGMGCWAIGGPFYRGDRPLGWSNVEDGESRRTIHAALEAGIRLFDTAAVYGAGHAERLLGEELKDQPDVLVVSKIGLAYDKTTKQLTGDQTDPAEVLPAIDRCLTRLQRDRIDILLLHLNDVAVARATPIFDEMERARQAGKIRAYGWSTDFPGRIAAMADREGFVAVEHAMNLFMDVPSVQGAVTEGGLTALIRSPLAMGVLSGRFTRDSTLPSDDIRSTSDGPRDYFREGRVDPAALSRLDAVRELLTVGRRTLVQGALCWLLAKSDRNLPVPGARTAAQMQENAGALDHGPLPADVMAEIETLMDRPPEGPARPR